MKMPFSTPTMSLILARVPECMAAKSVAQGTPNEIMANKKSLTGQYLSGTMEIHIPEQRTPHPGKVFKVLGASGNNLQNIDAEFPVGLFTCVTGVSGSGKSTLVNDTLYRLLAKEINNNSEASAPYKGHEGLDHFDKVVDIDQAPIGRTPRF